MKKHILLFLSFIGILATAQNGKTYDYNKQPKTPAVQVELLKPLKPQPTLKDYQLQQGLMNATPPALYKQEEFVTGTVTSQQFEAGNAVYTSAAADDFTVPAGKTWNITSVFAKGSVTGNKYPDSYNVVFYTNSSTNKPGSIIRTENISLTAGSHSPTLPLATPLVLSAGTYWVSVQAVLDFSVGGQWYWSTYDSATTFGEPFAWTNPGGGFATSCTSSWNTGSICISGQLKDLQFSLDGTEVTACKTFTSRILPTDPTHSQRVSRDGAPSTCAAPKTFPGLLGTTNFHYRTHTIQNSTATAQCVTVSINNMDPDAANQAFLVAYSGSFNPSNLGQNYLGDTGFSSGGNSTETMDIVIPANGTVVLVVSEVVMNTAFTADYKIEVTAPNCSVLLKVGDSGEKDGFKMYPNPVSGTLFVSGANVKTVRVTDASGRLIPVKNTDNQINVEQLTKGTYIVQIEDKDGKLHTEKIIKK